MSNTNMELFKNSNGKICLHIKTLNGADYVVSDENLKHYINSIISFNIKGVKPLNNSDIEIAYDNFNLVIRSCEKILTNEVVLPINNCINNFIEHKNVKELPHKKVTRSNKHTGVIVAASSIAFVCLLTILLKVVNMNYINVQGEDETKIETNTSVDNLIGEVETEPISPLFPNDKAPDFKNEEDTYILHIEYDDRSDTEKANTTKENYGELINKYALMYGLDPKLVTAIATQERGVHSPTMDPGGATGLMQIQNSVWLDEEISAYNFETESIERFTVTSSLIKDVETNIKIGCMILQNNLKYMKYNIIAAIQSYNMGYGNMKKILTEYSNETGKEIEDILSDTNDVGWLNNRDLIKVGDGHYVEHVLSWIGADVDLSVKNQDGKTIKVSVNNVDELTKVNY